MNETQLNSHKQNEIVSLKLELLNAKSKLNEALVKHHNFYPLQREMLELVREFDLLKFEYQNICQSVHNEVLPKLHSIPASLIKEDDTRLLSLSTLHEEATSQLQEFLDIHDSCVYLLDLHHALANLESSVNQLCNCTMLPLSWEPDNWESDDEIAEGAGDNFKSEIDRKNAPFVEIDEETYRLCTDSVVAALEAAETLFVQDTKFNKDPVFVFQGFRNTLFRCKCRLVEHVDFLWRQWIILDVPDLRQAQTRTISLYNNFTEVTDVNNDKTSNSQLSAETDPFGFLFGASSGVPTSEELFNHLVQLGDATGEFSCRNLIPTVPSFTRVDPTSRIIASLTVFAKPTLLHQLFRLIAALKESKTRVQDLAARIWTYLFLPWLDGTSNKSKLSTGSSKYGWPEFKTHLFCRPPNNENWDPESNTDYHHPHDSASYVPSIYPSWHLELLKCTNIDKKTVQNEDFLLNSCVQLSTIFEELSQYLFNIEIPCPVDNSGEKTFVRFIDLAVDKSGTTGSTLFDHQLATHLINGRLNVGLPCVAQKLNSPEFSGPVTQTVCYLIRIGKRTGFLTGPVDPDYDAEGSDDAVRDDECPPSDCGGASRLKLWLDNLPVLHHKKYANSLLEQFRILLGDRKKFLDTQLASTLSPSCEKPSSCTGELDFRDCNIDDDDDTSLDEDFLNYDEPSIADGLEEMNDQQLVNLMKSKSSHSDLARYLDLGHFDFPECSISLMIPALFQQIDAIIVENQNYLNRLIGADSVQHSSTDNASSSSYITQSCRLVESTLELIPRILLLFTSLVPTLHSDLAQSDLRFAALYHNDCMYLAHECLTLGERRLYPLVEKISQFAQKTGNLSDQPNTDSIKLLERSAAVSTCILVPYLRQAGTNLLLEHLRRERQLLLQSLEHAKGFRDASAPDSSHCCIKAIQDCSERLYSIAQSLNSLPISVFLRAMGVLCNFVCVELVKSILNLIDLTKSDCEYVLLLLNKIINTIISIFAPHQDGTRSQTEDLSSNKNPIGSLERRVPELTRLQGIIAVLAASSMAVIRDVLWNNGKGPLVNQYHLTASELRSLIKALYSSSSTRDQLLQMLH